MSSTLDPPLLSSNYPLSASGVPSRNLAKQLIVEEELRRAGVTIEYVIGEYPDTPEGNLSKHIRATIAEFEREKIKERNERGRRNVVRNGRIMLHGDRPPYGYRLSDDGKNIVIYESEAAIVRLIFQWYTVGDENDKWLSTHAIAKRLSEMKVPTWRDVRGLAKQRGAGEWYKATVLAIVHNEVYCGKWHYGKRRDTGGKKASKELIELEVPAIVSVETWQAAQKQSKENRIMSERHVEHDYLMRYRLTCSCGYSVAAWCCHCKKGKQLYLYYMCISMQRSRVKGFCGLPNFRADHVDALVWHWLKEWFKDPADSLNKLKAYKAEQEQVNAPILALLQTGEDLIADNRAQLDRLLSLYLTGKFSQDALLDRQKRLEETIAKLEAEQAKLRARLSGELSQDDITELMQFACDLSKGLDEADKSFEKRRRIIELLDVRGILAVEAGEKVVYASFALTPPGERGERLKLSDYDQSFEVF